MSIDVRLWHRQGRLRAGQTFSWLWMANGEPYGTIEVLVEKEDIVLSYRAASWVASNWKSIQQRVPITWTDCHFGGRRPWFCCAVRANGRFCGRRVAVLYGDGKSFACRNCHQLAYQPAGRSLSPQHQAIPENPDASWRQLGSAWSDSREAARYVAADL